MNDSDRLTDARGDSPGGSTDGGRASRPDEPATISGRQAVVGIYVVAVVLAAAFGAMLAVTVDPGVATLGPVEFSITPLNLALYGALSVGAGLGAFMGLAAAVAARSG